MILSIVILTALKSIYGLSLHNEPTRRVVLRGITSSGVLLSSQVAIASDEAFELIRQELEGRGSGGMKKLETLLDNEDTAGVVSFTREYAGYLRNGLVAKARKKVAEENKDQAKLLYDVILEDIIAINKLVRAGDQNEARRYFDILNSDLTKFLQLAPPST
mmetsp:Transcript_7401/g.10289  ORF Transcript_7401/g.10289 Transcript_7401/m.10289 type:complete len:161 (-) Transcript_7401:8-490(-)